MGNLNTEFMLPSPKQKLPLEDSHNNKSISLMQFLWCTPAVFSMVVSDALVPAGAKASAPPMPILLQAVIREIFFFSTGNFHIDNGSNINMYTNTG